MKKVPILFMLFILTACTGTPKINVVNSMGMTMELIESAYVPYTTAISPNGKYGLSGSLDNAIRLWDLSEGKQVNLLTGHTGKVTKAVFSPDGNYILSGGNDKAIRLWDTYSGKEIKQFTGHQGDPLLGVQIGVVAFSPNGNKALSASSNADRTIRLWDIRTGKEVMTIPSEYKIVRSACFSPDGEYLVAGGAGTPFGKTGEYVNFWGAESGRKLKQLKHSTHQNSMILASVNTVDISPNGKYALSGGNNGILKLWNIASGEEIRSWKAHSGLMGVGTARFSFDGKNILSAGADNIVKLWEVSTGKEIRQFTGHASGTMGLSYVFAVLSQDGKHVLSGGIDAALRVWDVSSAQEIAIIVAFENGEWLVVTKEGYYNSSEKGSQYLSVKLGDKSYTVNQFYDVFYRPDIVAAKLRGDDISGLVTITMQDAIKSPPPAVEFTSQIGSTDQPKVKVCYQVKSSGGGIGEVRLFHNGKLIQSDGYYREVAKSTADKAQLASLDSKAIYEDMRGVSIKGTADSIPLTSQSKGTVFEGCKDIDAVPGDNEVSVTAFNSGNTVQSYMKTINFNSKLKQEEPHLYILAVGIDHYKDINVNLKYAVKDAKDLEEKLKVQSATLYKPQSIHYVLLTDREATKANIVNKVNELSNTIKPQDSFILFVAGHGVLLQNQYYMLTHDYNGMVSDNSMISSNEIVEMSKKIKSLSQLFIFDTCHAGGVDTIVSGLYDARMSVLAKKMGLHIYASASDKQSAMDGYKGNGLFTYVLLGGLNNNKEADKNKDGKVTIVGLGEYSKKMTTEISKEVGHTQTPLIINFGKDSPIYKLQ